MQPENPSEIFCGNPVDFFALAHAVSGDTRSALGSHGKESRMTPKTPGICVVIVALVSAVVSTLPVAAWLAPDVAALSARAAQMLVKTRARIISTSPSGLRASARQRGHGEVGIGNSPANGHCFGHRERRVDGQDGRVFGRDSAGREKREASIVWTAAVTRRRLPPTPARR